MKRRGRQVYQGIANGTYYLVRYEPSNGFSGEMEEAASSAMLEQTI